MAYNMRWRKAIIVSVLCHLFLVAGAGYLSAHFLTLPIIEETYIELELANELQAENLENHFPLNTPASPESTVDTAPIPDKTQQPSTPSPVVTTNATPSVTTEDLTAPSISASASTANSAESNVSNSNATNNAGNKSKGSGLIPPSILNKVAPSYPKAAHMAGIEGTVVLKIQIYENGRSGSISVSRSSGNEALDNAAIAAVQEWRFVPAKDRDSGQAVACYTTIPISFHLK